MRVLLTVPSLDRAFGGPTAVAARLATELRGLGHRVVLAGAGEPGAEVVGLPIVSRFHGTPIPSGLLRFGRLARRADVVHSLGYRDPVSTTACLAADRAGVPYVLEPVGMHRQRLRSLRIKRAFDRSIGRRVLSRAGAVVATSELEAGELKADGVDPAFLVVRPNGIDLDDVDPLPARGAFRSAHGVPDDAPLVLSLGRITRKKGLVTFAEALARLPGAWGAVVGPDDGDGALEDLRGAIDRLGLRRMIVHEHGLWGGDKASALADSDVFCLCSATENFGNAPAEAAALGLPVVVSDRCGVAEYLDAGAHRVVAYGEMASLERALESLLRPGAPAAADAAASALRSRLSWPAIAEQQAAIYERIAH
jgi:glycosyltransferase involved in cell wall biosynthesis